MRVRVKYCGGCNPRYDRKALTEKLRAAFPLAEIIERHEDGPFDFVAVVCGCPAACAAHEDLRGGRGKMIITADEQFEELRQALSGIYSI
ncbi:MAG: hypothetical protein LBV01_02925 [Deltaproteobacteria bacterium]|jgi:4-hydroxybutyrate CoA-transferase|nr:hypothetical protein [Deltaproteobacteria bacterium]